MDPFANYAHIENSQQFWAELDEIIHQPFQPSSSTLNLHHQRRYHAVRVLKSFLNLCEACFDGNLTSQYNQDYCINRLFGSAAFQDAKDSQSETVPLHQLAAEEAVKIVQTFVLQYGESFPTTYKTLQASASALSISGLRSFLHRLVHQVWAGSYAAQAQAKIGYQDHLAQIDWSGADWDEPSAKPVGRIASQSKGLNSSSASKDLMMQISLREKAIKMLYETCRVQKLEPPHLKAFDERFIHHLFNLVEETRHHHDEAFNYQLIKLIVAMNEQYMVSGLGADGATPSGSRPFNLVLDVLKHRLNVSKTFGENLIFMLNRASSSSAEDLCMQILVLKLLYLLFTTSETACYFYTNDLKVLVDVFIRELSDLPEEFESLRYTYLRVLHPLLTNTQLCTYPYKRQQIRRLLVGLVSHGHLREVTNTTRRLVDRCLKAEWCVELDRLDGTSSVAIVVPIEGGQAHDKKMQGGVTSEGLPMLSTRIKGSKAQDATAITIAKTLDDSERHLTTDSIVSPISVDSLVEVGLAYRDSLAVPSHLKTRDKRVLSLSHPKPNLDRPDGSLRPSSQAGYRRTVSAAATPPRIDSPDLSDEGSEALSTASSWHAQMTQAPPKDLARVGSPLSLDVTASLAQQLDERVYIGKGLPSLHIRQASNGQREDSTATVTYESVPRRRKPPEPPAPDKPGRRTLHPSLSDQCVDIPPTSGGGRRRPPPPPPNRATKSSSTSTTSSRIATPE